MAKIIFITGGAASGKSRWAVSYFSACDNVLYMCTAPEMDKDISERIRWNNEHNYVEWVVKPGFKMDDAEISEHKFFIYDSIARYTSDTINAMCPDPEKMTDELQKEIEKKIIGDFTELIDKIKDVDGNMIMITIETGFSVCPESKSQVIFRDILGNVNQRIANISSEVYLSASGIQFKIK